LAKTNDRFLFFDVFCLFRVFLTIHPSSPLAIPGICPIFVTRHPDSSSGGLLVIRRLFPGWLKAGRTAPIRRPDPARLRVETLEARAAPSVILPATAAQAISSDKPMYIPITVTNAPAGAVTTTVSSGNTGLAASVVTGGRSISFTVKGKDSANQDFTGTITIRLFESAAPL